MYFAHLHIAHCTVCIVHVVLKTVDNVLFCICCEQVMKGGGGKGGLEPTEQEKKTAKIMRCLTGEVRMPKAAVFREIAP
jgi:hypothetical protein